MGMESVPMNKSQKRLAAMVASTMLVVAPVIAPTVASAQPIDYNYVENTDYNYLENSLYSNLIPDWIKKEYGTRVGPIVNNSAVQALSSLSDSIILTLGFLSIVPLFALGALS